MRKSLLVAVLLILPPSLLTVAQVAKPSTRPPARTPAPKPAGAMHAESAEPPAQLPVTRVSLYKNGVGFFEHAGRVTGDQAVTIDFTTAQLNDVLQSLTAVDLNGGRIAGAGYNSTTPLDEQLKALPLALSEDPTAVDFYNAIRGARVSVTGSGAAITGRLLNIEVVNEPAKENQPASEKRLLTVIGDDGAIRTVELTSATSVRLLDSQLHSDVTRYLELLASTRNDGLRHLTLQDNGPEANKNGARELHVSYLSEVPIWKSTYRILFTDPKAGSSASTPQTATLQGWSVVDNTTGADWINVRLSLIAGAPQSFIQPLSVPYYSRRPEIGLPQEAQLTPQTHESGEKEKEDATPPPQPLVEPAMAMDSNGLARGFGAGVAGPAGLGGGGNFGGGLRKIGGASETVTVNGVAAMPMQNAIINNQLYADLATTSLAPSSTTAAFDDYFAYNLTDPITIRKNESALVPILQTKINAERVTLWSAQQPTPLRALWVTNTSDLTLDRGSFTIVENGDFGGEGLLDPIHPKEKRLLSYAVDQAVRVSEEGRLNSQHATSLTAAKGVLRLHSTDISEITYVVHNAAADPRSVIVEHPVRQGFTLDSDPKPEETTSSVYRFRVATAPGATVRLHVGERHDGQTVYQLTNFNDNQLTFILNQSGGNSEAIKQALEPVLDARRKVADAQVTLDAANARLNDLRSDEDRQRANITALAGADKTSRDRFVHDLNTTEDQIAGQQKTIASAQANLQAAKDNLATRIESLQLDQKL